MGHIPGTERATMAAISLVFKERQRQLELQREGRFKYTPGDRVMDIDPDAVDFAKCAMLLEEVGEVSREVLALSGMVQEEPSVDNLRKELVQVAAISVAWIEALS